MEEPLEQIAIKCAKYIAKQWRVQWKWREYLSDAYIGLRKAKEKGVQPELYLLSIKSSIIDGLRSDTHHRRMNKHNITKRRLTHDINPIDHRNEIGSESDLLDIWRETRFMRRSYPLRLRVILYLQCVEGLSIKEICGILKLNLSNTWNALARFRREMNDE